MLVYWRWEPSKQQAWSSMTGRLVPNFWINFCLSGNQFHQYGISPPLPFPQGDGHQRPGSVTPDNAGSAPPRENRGKCCQCVQCQWDPFFSGVRHPYVNGNWLLARWMDLFFYSIYLPCRVLAYNISKAALDQMTR